jgi:hypothetical protein
MIPEESVHGVHLSTPPHNPEHRSSEGLETVKDGFDGFEGPWLLRKSIEKLMKIITRGEEF